MSNDHEKPADSAATVDADVMPTREEFIRAGMRACGWEKNYASDVYDEVRPRVKDRGKAA